MADSLAERMGIMPAVVVTGARQTGKSTLAQAIGSANRRYFSRDDLDTVDAARRRVFRRGAGSSRQGLGVRSSLQLW
ncbi:hypothetical protein DCC79_06065 [bacterium]|nr:hypothetical protein [Chloroflexi bacterium CFX6]RIL11046.1 MAG: hypothetical protein DCC79_06065 [bacterium]